MTDAERTYRRALRSYPARWRQERAEEVLGVLMAEHPTRAGIAETVSLVRHGLQERLSRSRRPGVWRAPAAAAAMATSTALAVTGGHYLLELVGNTIYLAAGNADGVYIDPLLPVYLLWVVTFVLLVTRRGRTAAGAACVTAATYVGAVALSWSPFEGPGGGPLTDLSIMWERLALLAPTLLLAALLLRPGTAGRAREAVGGRTVGWALGLGTAAGLLDVVGGISDAWPALLALLVTLGSFALRGVSPRASLLVLLGFIYIPLGGLTDGSGSRLPHQPLSLALTLLLLPVLGAGVALLTLRLADVAQVRGPLARLLDRAANALREDPPAAD